MTYANTTLLGLNQPTTGSESGVWGDDVNNGFTQLVEMTIAGTNNITQDSDITLAISNGNNSSSFTSTATNSTVVQYYILNCTGSRTAARNIIAPASSRSFLIINNTTGGYAITIKKSAGTGVSIAVGEKAFVYYDIVTGDYAKGTTTAVPGTVPTPYTANGVVYASSTSALATGSALTFDGTTFSNTAGGGQFNNLVKISNTANPYLQLYDGTRSGYLQIISGALNLIQTTAQPITFSTNNTEYMRLTSAGYLGVGTSSPVSFLNVVGDNETARFNSSTSTASSYIRVQNTSNTLYLGVDNSSGSSFSGAYSANIYASGAYPMQFWTSGTKQMTLDSSGNLGLGVTPTSWPSSWKSIEVGFAGNKIATGSANDLSLYTNTSWNGTAFTYNANGYATRYNQNSGVHYWFNAPSGTAGNAISFTQAMTLDNSGNLSLGVSSGTLRLTVLSSAQQIGALASSNSSSGYISFQYNTSTTSGYIGNGSALVSTASATDFVIRSENALSFANSSTERMRMSAAGGFSVGTTADPGAGAIYATGNITAYYSSDIKFKTNVQDIQDPLGIVTAIGSKTFDWTDEYLADHGGEDEYFQPKQSFGVIAQDVQKVFPQAVRTRTDGSLAVDYEKLAILSFGAFKQIVQRLEALESK